jgi:putative nucleotidyltransferase with HDIG domain
MPLPTKREAQDLLEKYVKDEYQRYHVKMVAVAMEGYAEKLSQDKDLWYITGLLHDLDYEMHPELHPRESLKWFKEWGYPESMIHAVEAHAYGYNGFETLPEGKLAAALMACDEISGIFYAYRKMNPVSYGDMKVSSIKKKFNDKTFAAKIERETIERGCKALGVNLDTHVDNLLKFFKDLD